MASYLSQRSPGKRSLRLAKAEARLKQALRDCVSRAELERQAGQVKHCWLSLLKDRRYQALESGTTAKTNFNRIAEIEKQSASWEAQSNASVITMYRGVVRKEIETWFQDWIQYVPRQQETWEDVISVWKGSDQVFAGKWGEQSMLPKEAALLIDLAVAGTLLVQLREHLADNDARIVVYCLLGLELVNDPVLKDLPKSLLARGDTFLLASNRAHEKKVVSDFAREAMERHCRGESVERWIDYGADKADPAQVDLFLKHYRAACLGTHTSPSNVA